jgi:hypothetical protein
VTAPQAEQPADDTPLEPAAVDGRPPAPDHLLATAPVVWLLLTRHQPATQQAPTGRL